MRLADFELLDAATRFAQREIRGVIRVLDRIQASHRRFLVRMRRLKTGRKVRLSK